MVRRRAYSNEQLAQKSFHVIESISSTCCGKRKNSTFVLGKREFQLLLVNDVDYSEAEYPRLIGAGGDDASFVRVASDDHWTPAQLWPVTLFDACVIGVQVDMNDRPILLHVSPGPIRL